MVCGFSCTDSVCFVRFIAKYLISWSYFFKIDFLSSFPNRLCFLEQFLAQGTVGWEVQRVPGRPPHNPRPHLRQPCPRAHVLPPGTCTDSSSPRARICSRFTLPLLLTFCLKRRAGSNFLLHTGPQGLGLTSRLPAFNMGFQLFNGIYYPLAGPAACSRQKDANSHTP